MEFDAEQCSLRLNGINRKENEHIKLGQHHTIELELNRPVHIHKENWDSVDLVRNTITAVYASLVIYVSSSMILSPYAQDVLEDAGDPTKKAEIEEVDEKATLMMVEPRSRKKIQRFGGHDAVDPRDVSDLDSSSDSDEEGVRRGRSKSKKMGRRGRRTFDFDDDYMEDERDVPYGTWTKSELLRIEKAVMLFG